MTRCHKVKKLSPKYKKYGILWKNGGAFMGKYEDAVRLWQSYGIASESDLDTYLSNFRIIFAYNSGKIENADISYHDTREIFENGKVTGYTGETRAIFEQQNQKLCYEFLREKIVKKEPISVELIREIHRTLTSGTYDEWRYVENGERPGEFKKHDYVTGIHEVGSPVETVAEDLRELVDEVNEYTGQQYLRVGAYLHARFESIHPFADGNGRVGRTLLNYYFMINNQPPLVVYAEDKGFYYACLNKYDEQEQLGSLEEFLKYEVEKTWEKTLSLSQGEASQHKPLNDILFGM